VAGAGAGARGRWADQGGGGRRAAARRGPACWRRRDQKGAARARGKAHPLWRLTENAGVVTAVRGRAGRAVRARQGAGARGGVPIAGWAGLARGQTAASGAGRAGDAASEGGGSRRGGGAGHDASAGVAALAVGAHGGGQRACWGGEGRKPQRRREGPGVQHSTTARLGRQPHVPRNKAVLWGRFAVAEHAKWRRRRWGRRLGRRGRLRGVGAARQGAWVAGGARRKRARRRPAGGVPTPSLPPPCAAAGSRAVGTASTALHATGVVWPSLKKPWVRMENWQPLGPHRLLMSLQVEDVPSARWGRRAGKKRAVRRLKAVGRGAPFVAWESSGPHPRWPPPPCLLAPKVAHRGCPHGGDVDAEVAVVAPHGLEADDQAGLFWRCGWATVKANSHRRRGAGGVWAGDSDWIRLYCGFRRRGRGHMAPATRARRRPRCE
jgi:hypothetical protein